MSKSAAAQEPSMEEILASIRRIISDETPQEPAAEPEPETEPAPEPVSEDKLDALFSGAEDDEPAPIELDAPEPEAPADDILELTDDLAVEDDPAPAIVEPVDDIGFLDEPEPEESEPEPEIEAPEPSVEPVVEDPVETPLSLLSNEASASATAAFDSLAQTILSHNARTLEDLVQEMLRPMLKTWLDDNLPTLVERLVRAEIERVSRGR